MAFDVSTDDIESRWRALDDDETDVGAQRLLDAGVLLRAARPGIEAKVAALAETPAKDDVIEAIRMCLAQAVIRFLRNPDLNDRQAITADGGITVGFDTQRPGGLALDPADITAIDEAIAGAGGTTYSKFRSRTLVSTWPWRTSTTY